MKRSILCFLGLLLTSLAWAEVLEINGMGLKRELTLKASQQVNINGMSHEVNVTGQGGSVIVNGTGQQVTLRGNFTSLTVNGSENRVRIDAVVAELAVNGMGQKVTLVNRPDRTFPPINKGGTNHEIKTVDP